MTFLKLNSRPLKVFLLGIIFLFSCITSFGAEITAVAAPTTKNAPTVVSVPASPAPVLTASKKDVPTQNLEPLQEQLILEPVIKEVRLLPVYTPYAPGKDEIIFSQTKNLINATDPTAETNKAGAGFPGLRGAGQLIIYTPGFGARTDTNEFGGEVIVEGNTVVELSGADSFIPANGVVISGHGKSKDWINSTMSIGTKIYINRDENVIYTYTTSESRIFEAEMKVEEARKMIEFYRSSNEDYNWKVPTSYIGDAENYVKKAKKSPSEVEKYAKLAIDAANDALKSVIPYKNTELKGVWVRPTEKTQEEIIQTIESIKAAGINNVFLETYFHGKTIYPSTTMKAYGFTPQYETFVGIDPLDIWVKELHKRNMKLHVWFETFYIGNSNPKDDPQNILAVNPGWSNKTKKDCYSVDPVKSPSEHNGYFLDPANPNVQNFILKLIDEITTCYKPDGVNIDYIRYPNPLSTAEAGVWGYTWIARKEFKDQYGVDPLDLKPSDPLWMSWLNYRRGKVTDLVKRIGEMCRQKKVYTTAVIFPDRLAALSAKQQDWKTWSTNNYINGFTPLLLTGDSTTASAMMKNVINAKSPQTDFYGGLFVAFMNGAPEDLIRQIHEARKLNANGVIIFDYAHLAPKYTSALSTSVFAPHPEATPSQPTKPTKPAKPCKPNKKWWQFGKSCEG